MTPQVKWTAAAGAMLAALCLAGAPAQAQTKATVSASQSISAKATVKSVDRATRHVVVTNEAGEVVSIKAPAEARNFDRLKPGDRIKVSYTLESEYVLSAPNTALPKDAVATVEGRTAKGDVPGGMAANHIRVTGAVVSVDFAKHTLKLVSPQGGAVHTVAILTPEGRKVLPKVKPGDTITAYLTESVLLTVDPL